MIDAKLFATFASTETDPIGLEVWGVWIPRRGDNAIFTFEVAARYLADLTAEIYQKNYDDVGDGVATGQSVTFMGVENPGRQSMTLSGAKELVRFKLTIGRNATLPDKDLGWVLLRFLQPVWFESVKV